MARPLWILCLQHHKYTTTPRRHVPASQTKHTHTYTYTQTVPNRQRNNFKKCQKGIIQKMSEKATPRKATTATPLSPRTSGWEEHTHTHTNTVSHACSHLHTHTQAHTHTLHIWKPKRQQRAEVRAGVEQEATATAFAVSGATNWQAVWQLVKWRQF